MPPFTTLSKTDIELILAYINTIRLTQRAAIETLGEILADRRPNSHQNTQIRTNASVCTITPLAGSV